MSDKFDIKTLTKQAEAGNGCALREELQKNSFEDSLKLLKGIAQQNHENKIKPETLTFAHLEYVSGKSTNAQTAAASLFDPNDASVKPIKSASSPKDEVYGALVIEHRDAESKFDSWKILATTKVDLVNGDRSSSCSSSDVDSDNKNKR